MDSRLLIIWGFSVAAMLVALGLIILSRHQRGKKHKQQKRSEPKIVQLSGDLIDSNENDPITTSVIEEEPSEIDLLADESYEQHTQTIDIAENEHRASKDSSLIMLYLHAEDGYDYAGYELLQALLSAHLRYGKMNIFHRHEKRNGTGELLFSVASLVEPGHFDLDNMGAFSTPGLVMFFQANQVKEPVKIFELMLATADRVAEDLGGSIHDNTDHPLTADRIQQLREQANQFEAQTYDTLD